LFKSSNTSFLLGIRPFFVIESKVDKCTHSYFFDVLILLMTPNCHAQCSSVILWKYCEIEYIWNWKSCTL